MFRWLRSIRFCHVVTTCQRIHGILLFHHCKRTFMGSVFGFFLKLFLNFMEIYRTQWRKLRNVDLYYNMWALFLIQKGYTTLVLRFPGCQHLSAVPTLFWSLMPLDDSLSSNLVHQLNVPRLALHLQFFLFIQSYISSSRAVTLEIL